MTKRRCKLFAGDILNAIEKIEVFIDGMDLGFLACPPFTFLCNVSHLLV
jgi:hypothetical protein